VRRFLTGTALIAAAVFLLAAATGAPGELPLPASIIVGAGNGAYRIDRDEHVHRVNVRIWPFPKDSSCCAAPGVWFAVRQGHVVLGRGNRTLWRSRGEYPKRFGLGAVRFGSQTVLFTYGNGLYLAPLSGAERAIGRSEVPLGFAGGGFYSYQWNRDLVFRSDTGTVKKTLGRPLGRSTYTVAGGVLYFMTGSDMMAAHGTHVSHLASMRSLGLRPRSTWFQAVGQLIELVGQRRLVLLRGDGSLFASTPWPRAHGHTQGLTGDPAPSPQLDAVAFVTDPDSGQSRTETVYLLRAGAHAAVPIHQGRVVLQPCLRWAALAWHGDWLLYSNPGGTLDVIDSTGTHRTIDLSHLLRHLRGAGNGPTVYWSGAPPSFGS
jgi:hypothetical protein